MDDAAAITTKTTALTRTNKWYHHIGPLQATQMKTNCRPVNAPKHHNLEHVFVAFEGHLFEAFEGHVFEWCSRRSKGIEAFIRRAAGGRAGACEWSTWHVCSASTALLVLLCLGPR